MAGKLRALLVEPERDLRRKLRRTLREWGFSVEVASNVREAEARLTRGRLDLALAEMKIDGRPVAEWLATLASGDRGRPVVFISDDASVEEACRAIKAGAHDYVAKPIDPASLRATLESIRRDLQLRAKASGRSARLAKNPGLGRLVGRSAAMRRVFDLIEVLGRSDTPVLIVGETGTGKELAARTIHELSRRAQEPFVSLNAAAIPKDLAESQIFGHEKGAFTGAVSTRPGCFELADGGILMLDEIAEMPVDLQPKLLRVLETGRVRRLGASRESSFDVRVLAATNRDPSKAVKEGRLRRDLFFRLSVFALTMPPLRRRKSDIALLAQRFLEEFREKHDSPAEGISDQALELLTRHRWPGNVRELRNVLERAVVLCHGPWIEPRHLPPALKASSEARSVEDGIVLPVGVSLADAEKALLDRTYRETGHNKSQTARILGVDVKTVRKKIKDYGLADG